MPEIGPLDPNARQLVALATRPKDPKYHYDLRCPGLERVVDGDTVATTVFENAFLFGTAARGRPCRVCALEPVLTSLIAQGTARTCVCQTDHGGDVVSADAAGQVQFVCIPGCVCFCATCTATDEIAFVTCTSQGSPTGNTTSYKWREATPSGQQRLARLAELAELRTVDTLAGLVAYGYVPVRAAKVIQANLRARIVDGYGDWPEPDVLDTFWGLTTTNPNDPGPADPWEMAQLICA